MQRRVSAIIASVVALLALASCTGQGVKAASDGDRPGIKRPNIVIIMADDLGYADISAYGIKRIPTPNIDRIGAEGVTFTQGYVTAPVCSPSRAALQTGRYQNRFGFEFNDGPARRDVEDNLGLATGEITLGQALKEVGYRTALIGKWHLGANDPYYPTNRGYEEFVGFLPGGTSYIDRSLPGVRHADNPRGEPEGGRAQGRNAYSQVLEGPQRTVVRNESEYLTEYWARRAVEFVGRQAPAEEPYFLYLSFNAPHDPLTVTQTYYDRFPHIKTEHHRIYAAMVSALDDAVGEVLNAIERSGEADDTIVYFVSDNGCAAYYEGMCACEPLRGGKLSYYEGGVRVPFLMRYPAALKGGQVYREPVSTLDVFPTVLAAAGGKLRTDRIYDGVNLMPFLSGKVRGQPHDSLMWRSGSLVSIRQGDWKLWKDMKGSYTLLFDLSEDPNETTSLAEKHPAKVVELEAALTRWGKDLVDPAWPSRPPTTYNVCGTPFEFPI